MISQSFDVPGATYANFVVLFGCTYCSVLVMMNKETRRISKLPNEIREEIGSYFVDSPPVVDEDNRKSPKLDESTADCIRTGLTVN